MTTQTVPHSMHAYNWTLYLSSCVQPHLIIFPSLASVLRARWVIIKLIFIGISYHIQFNYPTIHHDVLSFGFIPLKLQLLSSFYMLVWFGIYIEQNSCLLPAAYRSRNTWNRGVGGGWMHSHVLLKNGF